MNLLFALNFWFSIILLFSGAKERETEECCCNKGTARKGWTKIAGWAAEEGVSDLIYV